MDGVVLISSHADDPLPGLLHDTGAAVLAGRPRRPSPLAYVEDRPARRCAGRGRPPGLAGRLVAPPSGPPGVPAGRHV